MQTPRTKAKIRENLGLLIQFLEKEYGRTVNDSTQTTLFNALDWTATDVQEQCESDSQREQAPAPEQLLCDQIDPVTLAEHTKYVEQFLNEMYATMIDPCEQPFMKVADMCALLLKTAREQRQSAHDASEARSQAAQEIAEDNLADYAKRFFGLFDQYRNAWLREIGNVIRPKHWEIDGFVLRTRDIYEKAQLVDRMKRVLIKSLNEKRTAQEMFDDVFKMLAEDRHDEIPTN